MAGPYMARRLKETLACVHDILDRHAARYVETASALAALDAAVAREFPLRRGVDKGQ